MFIARDIDALQSCDLGKTLGRIRRLMTSTIQVSTTAKNGSTRGWGRRRERTHTSATKSIKCAQYKRCVSVAEENQPKHPQLLRVDNGLHPKCTTTTTTTITTTNTNANITTTATTNPNTNITTTVTTTTTGH